MADAERLRAAVLETAIALARVGEPGWMDANEIPEAGRVAFYDGVNYALAVLLERMLANNVPAEAQLQLAIELRKERD